MQKNEDGKKEYKLYLMAMNQENMELAVQHRFNRVNSKYILIYSDELWNMVSKCHYHIIDENEIQHLSDSEKLWLFEANMKIIAEESELKQEEILKRFEERISILEKELEREADNLKAIKDDGSKDGE